MGAIDENRRGGAAVSRRLALRAAALLLLSRSASARTATLPDLAPLGETEVQAVLAGGTLLLDDGRRLRLVGLEAPLGRAAVAALDGLVTGRAVALHNAGNPLDRHGRVLAHVVADGIWVEGELLTRGLARVQSFADNRRGVPEMLVLERRARRARRGLWADPAFAVRRAEEAGRYAGTIQLVEGAVVDTARVEGQLFLNFAADWRTGFTARLGGEALRLFRAAGIDPAQYRGMQVRVRGFVLGGQRPSIEITHPEQVEPL
jgi:endonuclease YncB( thermonuclease family)